MVIFIAMMVLFLVVPDAAMAQRSASWVFKRDDGASFAGAGVCGANGCIYLVCQPKMPDSLAWEITMPNNGNIGQRSSVTWRFENVIIVFPMYKSDFGTEHQGYDAYFNPNNPYSSREGPTLAQSQILLQALRRGNSVTVNGEFLPTLNLSLRGSNAALSQLLAQCPFAG